MVRNWELEDTRRNGRIIIVCEDMVISTDIMLKKKKKKDVSDKHKQGMECNKYSILRVAWSDYTSQ